MRYFPILTYILRALSPNKDWRNISLRFFDYGGFPPESDYLFLGNYMDQRKQSIEIICFFFADKIKYPDNFFLLLWNHEHIYFLYTIKIKNILQKLFHNLASMSFNK